MPILKGQDLIDFVEALKKKDSEKAKKRRREAVELLKLATLNEKEMKESMEFRKRSEERD